MSEAQVAAISAKLAGFDGTDAGASGVWPVNLPIVTAWCFIASQWRTASTESGGRLRPFYVGLDYAGCRTALDARGIEVTAALWDGLTIMEIEARDALNGAGEPG